MRNIAILALLAGVLAGCGSSEPEPVQGDNPAAATGREVPADMQRSDGPPRNTLPAGQGRTGGGDGMNEGGATTR